MSAVQFLRDILLPDCSCWFCHHDDMLGDDHLCDSCREKLHSCPAPAALTPLDGLSGGLMYEDPARNAVMGLKYNKQRYYARLLAHYMSVPAAWQIDCMTPVPLHPLKLWLRSYNQSEELCLALREELSLPVRTDLIKRSRYTKSQTQLQSKEREKNVRGAFTASSAASGLSILLVDDVATTQATLVACAKALKKAGAKRVYAACACLARR